MITVNRLHKNFGGIQAVNDVSLTFEKGRITGLIGPNGAGKSTLFDIVAGRYTPTSGQVLLDGEDVTGLPPHSLFARGLLRTFQVAHEFATLTVRDNLMVVPGAHPGDRLGNVWLRRDLVRRADRANRDRADEVLGFLRLEHMADELAGNLSGGQKKLLELGRAMMAESKIIFLDEIGAGVNRTLLRELGEAILRLNRERGDTFCLIEHDMDFIARLCDPVVVMAEGQVIATGTVEDIKSNDDVIDAYLGSGPKTRRSN
ncbi:MAG: ABC transporter ATP-binding protein [Salaquimonas sp.]|jgi:branched-chain amino acid transport system ATP-binding protein|nr:ABC transporter ATP-binding protein [Salaquimonas sp.]